MKLALGARLALSYLAVILIGMGIAAALGWLAVERLYLDTQKANLLAQAELAAAAVSSNASPTAAPAFPYSQASNVMPGIHTRVINDQGAVLIDLAGTTPLSTGSSSPAGNAVGQVTPDDLLNRPEVAQALSGQPATAIRRVEAGGGGRVLYAAAPVLSASGQVSQIIYLATPLPETSWAALPAGLRWQLAGAILLAVLIASLAGLFLSRGLTRPLAGLAQAAQAVAAGDLDQTVPANPSVRELAVVGEAFNAMTTSLRQSNQSKNAFIADVTHELRTPLTVIKGTIETLQDGALDDLDARGPFLEAMNTETERLIRMVNDLLVLTRADAGALNLQLEPVALGELARGRCARLERVAQAAQVRIVVAPCSSEEECTVTADADRLAQVLDNLLANAIRYAPPESEVCVTVERQGDEIACRVADAGPGIPPEHLPLIFERFYRVEPARARDNGGSGLGLAIVQGLVAAHGGRVAADSAPGQGTAITFWLPAAQN